MLPLALFLQCTRDGFPSSQASSSSSFTHNSVCKSSAIKRQLCGGVSILSLAVYLIRIETKTIATRKSLIRPGIILYENRNCLLNLDGSGAAHAKPLFFLLLVFIIRGPATFSQWIVLLGIHFILLGIDYVYNNNIITIM